MIREQGNWVSALRHKKPSNLEMRVLKEYQQFTGKHEDQYTEQSSKKNTVDHCSSTRSASTPSDSMSGLQWTKAIWISTGNSPLLSHRINCIGHWLPCVFSLLTQRSNEWPKLTRCTSPLRRARRNLTWKKCCDDCLLNEAPRPLTWQQHLQSHWNASIPVEHCDDWRHMCRLGIYKRRSQSRAFASFHDYGALWRHRDWGVSFNQPHTVRRRWSRNDITWEECSWNATLKKMFVL